MKAITSILVLLLVSFEVGQVLSGKASWYTASTNKHTASGYKFDPGRLEAAHKYLPFGTVVKVRRPMKDGPDLFTTVVITDRGPYIAGRIIDLTPAAAKELDMLSTGVAPCKVLILKLGPCKTYKCYKKHPYERGRKVY